MSTFDSITSVGGLLPSDLLSRVAAGDTSLPGVAPEHYGLVPGERLNDAITRSWNRLDGVWKSFVPELDALPESERTATSLTRDRWLRPLLDELGFAGLPTAPTETIDGKDYAISHRWADTVPIHLPGARIAVDRRTAGIPGAAQTSPHGLVQEFLNRSDSNLWGMVSNGLTLRVLRDNASLTRQAYIEFDLAAMFTGERFSDFVVLWLTCHRTRFEGDPPEKCILEQWTQEAAASGTRALDKLRDGVEQAMVSLGEGIVSHPANSVVREQLRTGELAHDDLQRQLLRVVYRMLFLLVAESRDLLLSPSADATTRERYRRFYSVDRLRYLATKRRGTNHDDLWDSHQLVVRALEHDGAPSLGLAPFGSFLWSQAATSALNDCRLNNRHLLDTIRALTLVRDDESRVDRAVDYRNLGAEELGSIYESLLELHAEVDPDARTFSVGTAAGNERKTTGSYYTPTSLINELLDSALDPVLAEAAAKPDAEQAILSLSVIDPAVGSGHFLIAAANRIAQRLASVRAGGIEPAPDEVRAALRDVVGSCVHGIDVNPMAVELCKVSLWLEAMEPGKPLSFLDHRIVCGNALLGTTPRLLAEGIPDDAYKPLEGDEKSLVSSLKKRNKAEREGQLSLALGDGFAGLVQPIAAAVEEIDAIADDSVAAIDRKTQLYRDLASSPEATKAKLAADAWCAAFVCLKAKGAPEITTDTVRRIADDPARVSAEVLDRVRELAEQYRFFHLHLAFPDVIVVPDDPADATNQRTGWDGGFDVVLGNPPWDRVKLQAKEFFSERAPEIAQAPTKTARSQLIEKLADDDPALYASYQRAARFSDGASHYMLRSGRFPLCGRGDINTYTVFAESMRDFVARKGRVGAILQSGIATDDLTKFFFQDLVRRRNLASLFDFENRLGVFPGVHRSIKFCLLTLAGDGMPVETADFVFFGLEPADMHDTDRRFTLTPDEIALLNPRTLTCPIFRNRRDAEISRRMYTVTPVLNGPVGGGWGLTPRRVFDMSKTEAMALMSASPEGLEDPASMLEGKLLHAFDHRFASYENGHSGAASDVPATRKSDACYRTSPRYWTDRKHVDSAWDPSLRFLVGFRDICRSTDERTAIASVLPFGPTDYTVRVLGLATAEDAALLTSLLNSPVFDYAVRLKQGGTHLSNYISMQCPVPTWAQIDSYAPLVGGGVRDWVLGRSLELSYTAWDLVRFGRALGASAPYVWDEGRREVLRADLDALYFHVYSMTRVDTDYILDTFPIVKRKDEEKYGEYRTKRLILECYDRMAEARASGNPYETILDPPPADPSLCHPESTRPDWADLYLEL